MGLLDQVEATGAVLRWEVPLIDRLADEGPIRRAGVVLDFRHRQDFIDDARQFEAGEFEAPTLERHVTLAADCIEQMPPETWIQRLVGEVSDSGVIAPQWGKTKLQIYNLISDELKRRGTHQSSHWRE